MKIKRKIYNQIYNHLKEKEITMLIGPRQAGKTTIMKELEKDLLIDEKDVVFLNLDIDRDFDLLESQEKFLHFLKTKFKGFGYVFIDELQKRKNAGSFMKGLYDMDLHYKFIISGSGSIELKSKTHESLAGRKRIFTIYPLSFEEFLSFRINYEYEDLKKFQKFEKDKFDILLEEYLKFGGYPKIVLSLNEEEKFFVINEIVESFLHKDILNLIKREKLDNFKKLIKILGSYNGKLIEYNNLSQASGISQKTIKNYLTLLEETYIIIRVSPFSKKRVGEITKMPTIYFIDNGFANYALNSFGIYIESHISFCFQSMFFRILQEKYFNKNISINFWRTNKGQEIDFVISLGEELNAFEVKYSYLNNQKTNFASFKKRYKKANTQIVNKINFLEFLN